MQSEPRRNREYEQQNHEIIHQHDLDPERAERATMGKTNDTRGLAGTHAPDLQPCQPVWPVPAEYERAPVGREGSGHLKHTVALNPQFGSGRRST